MNNMWFTFFVGVSLFLLMIYLPGYLLFRAFSFDRISSFCLAPIAAVGEISFWGTLLGLAGLSVAWFVVPFVVLLLNVVIYTTLRTRRLDEELFSGFDWKLLLLFMAIAFVATMWFFVKNLDGPSSFVSEFDNAYHFNAIKTFASIGRYSVLQSTIYPTDVAPMSDLSFYPAGWHVLCALTAAALNCGAAMAENIGIFAFISFVFPASMFAFLNLLFEGDKKVLMCCGVFLFAFASFPWGFLIAGPLYSNLAAMCLLPGAMMLFMAFFKARDRKGILRLAILFLSGLVTLAVTQPNTVFTAIIILTPYTIISIAQKFGKHGKRPPVVAMLVFLLVVAFVLFACYKMPFFDVVVHNGYRPYTLSVIQAFVDYADLGYRNAVSQPVVSFFVIVGILTVLALKRHRWLLFSCAYFCIAYISAGAVAGGLMGDFFSGFWYNDVDRLAANCALIYIPLAGMGLCSLLHLVACCYREIASRMDRNLPVSVNIAIVMILLFLIFRPSYIDAGNGWVNTAFGQRDARLAELATSACSIDSPERDFLLKVKAVTGDNLVLNDPFDGSAFAYGICDINIWNRHHSGHGGDDDLIDRHLREYESREDVKDALKRMDAKYLLLLDVKGYQGSTVYRDHYDEDKWSGIADINDSTPGFTVVLSDGDMRLYKIDDVS